MKRLIKPLLFVAISSLVGVAQAQLHDYSWLRSVQLNPTLTSTLATQNASFYVLNPELNLKQTFIVTTPAVCVDSRKRPGLQFCTVSLCDVSFSGLQTAGSADQYKNVPHLNMNYSQHQSGNVAMNVLEVSSVTGE